MNEIYKTLTTIKFKKLRFKKEFKVNFSRLKKKNSKKSRFFLFSFT